MDWYKLVTTIIVCILTSWVLTMLGILKCFITSALRSAQIWLHSFPMNTPKMWLLCFEDKIATCKNFTNATNDPSFLLLELSTRICNSVEEMISQLLRCLFQIELVEIVLLLKIVFMLISLVNFVKIRKMV
jgi:hypothetical protein